MARLLLNGALWRRAQVLLVVPLCVLVAAVARKLIYRLQPPLPAVELLDAPSGNNLAASVGNPTAEEEGTDDQGCTSPHSQPEAQSMGSNKSEAQFMDSSETEDARVGETCVQLLRSGLLQCGDAHIVDDAEQFELVDVLGKGGFGLAELRGMDSMCGEAPMLFVVKRVSLRGIARWQIKHLLQEISNGAAMRHPHIVRTYGAYLAERTSDFCFVIQYAAGGTLERLIRFQRSRNDYFDESMVSVWLAQLSSAVQYMHDRSVLHRDISSGNIFLSMDGDVLLGDLGLSREMATEVVTRLGTPPYMSPERIRGERYGASCDLWSIGVILYEMMSLERPFDGDNMLSVGRLITDGTPTNAAKRSMERSPFSDALRVLASCAASVPTLLQPSNESMFAR